MKDQMIIETENKTREVAKTLFAMLKTVQFMDKKVNAVNTVLSTAFTTMDNISEGEEFNKLIALSEQNHQTLTDELNTLRDAWSKVEYKQMSEKDFVSKIDTTILADIITGEQKAVKGKINSTNEDFKEQKSKMIDELEAAKQTLDTLKYAELANDIVKSVIDELNSDIERYINQTGKRNVQYNEQISAMESQVTVILQCVNLYEQYMSQYKDNVERMDLAITRVESRLNAIAPKELNVSKDGIIQMFEDMSVVETTPVSEEQESEKEEVVEETAIAIIEQPVEVQETEHVKHKRKWQFWK